MVLLNTELKGTLSRYTANSIIELGIIMDRKTIYFREDVIASDDGQLCNIKFVI